MFIRNFLLSCCVLPVALLVIGCQQSTDMGGDAPQKPDRTSQVDFVKEVRPILETHCIRCHNDQSLFGGLNLMNRAKAFRGGDAGPVIIPGEPDLSRLFGATGLDHGRNPQAMPATGPRLNEEEKKTLRLWIEQGAEWPEGEDGDLKPIKMEPGKA